FERRGLEPSSNSAVKILIGIGRPSRSAVGLARPAKTAISSLAPRGTSGERGSSRSLVTKPSARLLQAPPLPNPLLEHRTSNIQHRTSKFQHPSSNIQVPFEVCAWHEGEKIRRNYDLEERLLEFASRVIDLTESLPQTRAANHVGAQILRSGTSPFLNHGETESDELIRIFYSSIQTAKRNAQAARQLRSAS